jgi:outer membrane protein
MSISNQKILKAAATFIPNLLEERTMRKKIIIVFCMVALLLFFVNVSFAEGPAKKWGIGGRISFISPEDDTIEGIKFDPDEGVFVEGMLQYLANNWFSMELSVGYAKVDVDAEAFGLSLDFGELEQIPILLTGRLHYWFANSMATIYGGGGVGYYIRDFKLSGLVTSAVPGAAVDVDDSFGFHINAGIEFFFTENMALDLDLKYIWSEADFDFRDSTGVVTGEGDLNAFVAGLSLKYFF